MSVAFQPFLELNENDSIIIFEVVFMNEYDMSEQKEHKLTVLATGSENVEYLTKTQLQGTLWYMCAGGDFHYVEQENLVSHVNKTHNKFLFNEQSCFDIL
ncbi:hypothetical protein HPULCUR_010006 [Helicostylum pulchrum]|uniref:Uncharacterized protein n=1 Tax=Helicostylum pulchrum TaxID=562976 RepID=A0ABP9YC23_9FUNG